MPYNLKSKKIIILSIILGVIAGTFWLLYEIYKPHESILEKKITFNGDSKSLLLAIKENPTTWINTVVKTTGKITSKDASGFTLDATVYCQISNPNYLDTLPIGSNQSVLGRVVGYDTLLDELKLDQIQLQK